jgi:hypothetical protein
MAVDAEMAKAFGSAGGRLAAPCQPLECLHAHPHPAAAGRRDLDPRLDLVAVTHPGGAW